jgi:hypothetical protein
VNPDGADLMKTTSIRKSSASLAAVLLTVIGISLSPADADTAKPSAAAGVSGSVSGNKDDFDYLVGAWTTRQKRLKARGVGSSEWIEAPPNQHCAQTYLGGLAILEQSQSPEHQPAGLFLYTFNTTKQQWAIYWVNGKTGQLDPPNIGGFAGTKGEFYGDDEDNGRPIRVRIVWTKSDQDHARWEQAYSYDGRTWETNWISDFTRGDPAVICPKA